MNIPEPTDTEGLEKKIEQDIRGMFALEYQRNELNFALSGVERGEMTPKDVIDDMSLALSWYFVRDLLPGLLADTKVTGMTSLGASPTPDISNPPTPPDQGTNELDRILETFKYEVENQWGVHNSGSLDAIDSEMHAKTALSAHIRRVTLEARQTELKVLLDKDLEDLTHELDIPSYVEWRLSAISKELQEIEGDQPK